MGCQEMGVLEDGLLRRRVFMWDEGGVGKGCLGEGILGGG